MDPELNLVEFIPLLVPNPSENLYQNINLSLLLFVSCDLIRRRTGKRRLQNSIVLL